MSESMRTEVPVFFKNQQPIANEVFTHSALNPAHSVVVRACAADREDHSIAARWGRTQTHPCDYVYQKSRAGNARSCGGFAARDGRWVA